jgi:hypothetical protein
LVSGRGEIGDDLEFGHQTESTGQVGQDLSAIAAPLRNGGRVFRIPPPPFGVLPPPGVAFRDRCDVCRSSAVHPLG